MSAGWQVPEALQKLQHVQLEVLRGGDGNRNAGVGVWVVLSRPRCLNALNMELVDELHEVLDHFLTDEEVRVVLLRGSGKGFCSGADILAQLTGKGGRRWKSDTLESQQRFSSLILKLRRIPQPVIAAVHGAAAGGGFSLALAADIRVAGESACMHAAFIQLGLSGCELGTSYFLPRIVGRSLAAELLMTGAKIGSARALSSGLVSRVVPDDALVEQCNGIAMQLLSTSRLGLRITKVGLEAAVGKSLEDTIALEDRGQVLCLKDPECMSVGKRMVRRIAKL